ncbi:histidine phosphatase family protein [Plebeiibacterium marinum]|uniref:Histidine phosphatase family protein n=1 Tax=Plebeiibacterium marinum TaxID=2992111 RepID=A0AAE3SMM7_9BACT|nr:histidine phosphatase family protein [Plebeiobacterium marinum]MCW3807715.1 histidine phosphatase family protein [Plebeiobacterium marinum]
MNNISKVYKSKNACPATTCIDEINPQLKQSLTTHNKALRQIYLIRHAKPQIKKKWLYSSKGANQYISNYNTAPIIAFDTSSVKNNLLHKHTIYCSTLRRSKETAHSIFDDNYPIVPDSLFREFENKIIKAPSFIILPLPVWQIISRGTWALGAKRNGIESYKEAKSRAKNASLKLVELAQHEETSILVAHGILNGAIKKNLKKDGWHTIKNKGNKNLGSTILIKIYEH